MLFEDNKLLFHGTTKEFVQAQFRRYTGLSRGEPITGSPLYFGALERGQKLKSYEEPRYRGVFVDTEIDMPIHSAARHQFDHQATPILLVTCLDLVRYKIDYDNSTFPLIKYGWPKRTMVEIDLVDLIDENYFQNEQLRADNDYLYDEQLVKDKILEALIKQNKFPIPQNGLEFLKTN